MRLHRTQRETQGIGHFLIRELLHMTKRERGAIRGREPGRRGRDFGARLAARRVRLRADVGLIGVLGELVDRRLASVPALDVVEARVGRDPVEPRTEWQRGVVLMQSAIGANKSLLRTIVRCVGVSSDAERDVEHPSSVSFDQSRVRISLTGKTCLYDVLVGIGQRSLRRPRPGARVTRTTRSAGALFRYSRPAPWT